MKNLFAKFNLQVFYVVINFFILLFTHLFIIPLFFIFPLPNSFLSKSGGIILFSATAIITGIFISLVISKYVVKPLRLLAEGFSELSRGNFSVRLDLNGPKEIKAISTAFNSMAKELGSIELMRSDFINDFSHEFKTPAVSITGFAKLLKREGLGNEVKNRYLDIIIDEAGRLSALTGNILMLSKLDGSFHMTDISRFNVTEQIRRAVILLLQKYSEKNVDFDFDCEEIYISKETRSF